MWSSAEMTHTARAELISLVREWLDDSEEWCVRNAIANAHVGRPDGVIVTSDNQHLFRQYRNSVSAEAQDIIDEAKRGD